MRGHVVDAGIALVVACAAAWLIGFVAFIRAIPETVEDTETRTDAIVVLTGGAERLATGLKLLDAGKASAVFVSGVNPQVGVIQVLQAVGEDDSGAQRLAARVEAGHGARDTAGNAAETAAWMHQRGFHSLRLVTASYHMPRSQFEFESDLPDTRIIPHPVFTLPEGKSTWWRHPAVLGLLVGEYNKLLVTWLMHGVVQVLAVATG